MQVAAGKSLLIELNEGSVAQHELRKGFVFGVTSIAPVDFVWFGEFGDFFDPRFEFGIGCSHGTNPSMRI